MICFDVVIPTIGRPSLAATLAGLASGPGPQPERVFVVDDRPDCGSATPPLAVDVPEGIDAWRVEVLRSHGRGPAAARNVGWRAARSEWVAFLDDDVVPTEGWRADLAVDLATLAPEVAGSQGRIDVPLPADRAPTDWERNVAGLMTARWITADMAYRREALTAVDGFDEHFRRAYREDADLAARVADAGYRLTMGQRRTVHPVRPAPWSVSVALQVGNSDDARMRRQHGPGWRRKVGANRGRFSRHLAITVAAVAAVVALLIGRRRVALVAAGGWAVGTLELAAARIRPGPRHAREIMAMVATSVAIPPVACWHRACGWAATAPWPWWRRSVRSPRARPAAVLFDRDGTLVVDVPYNGDPTRVEAVAGARQALDRLRSAGISVALISNQSGIARGLLTPEQVEAVNDRVDELLGPFDRWFVCPHDDTSGCECRKPEAGLVLAAAGELGVHPHDCIVVGDIGSDVEAARRAGARSILVPNGKTRPEEVTSAPIVARDLQEAVDLMLGSGRV